MGLIIIASILLVGILLYFALSISLLKGNLATTLKNQDAILSTLIAHQQYLRDISGAVLHTSDKT